MNITAVVEDRFRDYIISVFEKHKERDIQLTSFGAWQGENYVAAYNGEKEYEGVPILPLKELKNSKDADNEILVAGFNTGYLSQMMRSLTDNGFYNVSAIRWFSIHKKADFIKENSLNPEHIIPLSTYVSAGGGGIPYLGELQVHVTDNCNLNCKACTHFTPFVKERRPMNFKQFQNDLNELKRLFSNIYVFQLMGGEPLLEAELCLEMARAVRETFPTCSINLITNGTLIDKMKDEFWQKLRSYDVTVRVSVYPVVTPNYKNISSILEKHNIPFMLEVLNKIEFDKFFSVKPTNNPIQNMRRCHGRGCYTLYYGKITKCPMSIYAKDIAKNLGKIDDDDSFLYAKDAVDIYKEESGWNIIKQLEEPCDFCAHCDISNLQKISWEMTGGKPKLSDWFIDL